jgi:predicted O-methyltransferase YrrM
MSAGTRCEPAPGPLPAAHLRRALAVQAGALSLALAGWTLAHALGREPGAGLIALLAGGLAPCLAWSLGQERWWLALHAAAVPCAWLLLQVPLPPWVYLAAALLLALIQSNAASARVPLFLTSRRAVEALLARLPAGGRLRFLELGSGLGGVALAVARQRPGTLCTGIESAPLPYLLGAARNALAGAGCNLVRRSFWRIHLAEYDVVYAYLSPAPMARLWDKAVAEMNPGALLVSNSFPIPGVVPEFEVQVDDATGSALYGYRIPERAPALPGGRPPIPGSGASAR